MRPRLEDTLAVLLAGGAGERLAPLTKRTAKPAVPFGGVYRIIDFTLSNCVNSGLRRIFVLTQYKALELNRHIRLGWNILSPELGEYIEVISPSKGVHTDWYAGTADAVYQNLINILEEKPRWVFVLSGDHIYKMDYRDMLDWHLAQRADITLATIDVLPSEASRFGIVKIAEDYRIEQFLEKPPVEQAPRSRFDPNFCSASMGVYLFNTEVLREALTEDAKQPDSSHDFGKDVLPRLVNRCRIVAFDFRDSANRIKYWRDVGTIDAYYEANMDLVAVTPQFNLYDENWPIRTLQPQRPPAKFVFAIEGRRMGVALDSIVSPGCIISGGRVIHSVLSPGVRVNSYSEVDSCILMHGVEIGRYSRLRRVIVDAGVRIPEHSVIGYDLEADRQKGYHVTPSGIVVVPQVP